MYCEKCGNQLSENAKFCSKCGAEKKKVKAPEQKEPKQVLTKDAIRDKKREEKGIPSEVKGWNWGATLIPLVWGLWHKIIIYTILGYLLATLIPVLGFIIWAIIFGIKGNEWAWKYGEWENIDQFKESQRKWKIAGFIIFPTGSLLLFLYYTGILEDLLFN